jgi:hypothetical protein
MRGGDRLSPVKRHPDETTRTEAQAGTQQCYLILKYFLNTTFMEEQSLIQE